MRALLLALALLPFAASAAPSGKVGLGLGAGAGGLEGSLSDLISEHAEVVAVSKPPKGKKRAAWAKSAEKASALRGIVVAEVKGKRLKLGLWVAGKAVSSSGADLKGGAIEGAARLVVKNWLAANLAPGAARGGSAPPPDEDEDEDEKPPVVEAPAAPIKGPGGRSAPAPVVAAPPPPAEEPLASEPAAKPVDEAPAAAAPAPGGPHGGGYLGGALGLAPGLPPLLRVRVAYNNVARGFNYSDALSPNLRPYAVTFMPAPGVSIEAYPLTFTGMPALASVALTFGFCTSLGVTSARADVATAFPTTYSSLSFGAAYRLQLGEGFDSLALVPSIGFASTSFALDPVGNVRETELPNVSYPGLRFGLGLDAPLFWKLRLLGGFAYQLVGSPGEIIGASFFRAGSAGGLDARVGVSVGLVEHLALELGVTYQHFFYSFQPEVGDAFVAGGALDQFVLGNAGIRVDL